MDQGRANTVLYLGPYDSLEISLANQPQGWWRDLARRLLGNRVVRMELASVLDEETLSQIAKLDNLEVLTIDTRKVNRLTMIGRMSALKEITLYGQGYPASLSFLSEQRRLERLTLANTLDTDLSPLASLTNLKELRITATSASDLRPIATLERLEVLDLTNSSPIEDLSPISGLVGLKELLLTGTSVRDLAPVSGLRNLSTLHLGSVSDLSPVRKIEGLQVLHLSYDSTSDSQIESLQRALPGCTINH